MLSVATAAVILPFATGATMKIEGARRTIAAKLASDLIEQIQETDFDWIQTYYDDGAFLDGNGWLVDEMGMQILILTDSVYSKHQQGKNNPAF